MKGYDGAKQVKGRKRFILVDSLGLVMSVLLTEADVAERQGAEWLLTALGDRFPRLELVWVDGGFSGEAFAQRIADQCGLTLEGVKRPEGSMGFGALPRRWVVERTFAWLGNYRRWRKDYEYWVYRADCTI